MLYLIILRWNLKKIIVIRENNILKFFKSELFTITAITVRSFKSLGITLSGSKVVVRISYQA